MPTPFSELFRIDPLTECRNYLGFLETLAGHSWPDQPDGGRSREAVDACWVSSAHYSAVLFVEMNQLRLLNESQGRAYGDSAIRWMGLLLQEETGSEVYRIGGVEFVVLLKLDTRQQHEELMQRILPRMQREAQALGFPGSPADVVLLYLDEAPSTIDTLMLQIGQAMVRLKENGESNYMAFEPASFNIPAHVPGLLQPGGGDDGATAIRWLSMINIHYVLAMGNSLDRIQEDALTDSISNLPNMRAALLHIERAVQGWLDTGRPFSLLMIDGDNIRAYNTISYAAGDDMIRQLCALFTANLRPDDFVARWRVGDEFIAILPDTPAAPARVIGERFRRAVKEASTAWLFPVSISIGIAVCPVHGTTSAALIDLMEAANKRAKDQGKDQVVVAEP
jgi:diguanylate cyclase (GGDEF)-like protein